MTAAWHDLTRVCRGSVVCCREAPQLRRRPHHSCAMWTPWMPRSPARSPAPCRPGWRPRHVTRRVNTPLPTQAGGSNCPAALVMAAQRQQAPLSADSSRRPVPAAAQQQRRTLGPGSTGNQQRQLRQRALQGWCHCPARGPPERQLGSLGSLDPTAVWLHLSLGSRLALERCRLRGSRALGATSERLLALMGWVRTGRQGQQRRPRAAESLTTVVVVHRWGSQQSASGSSRLPLMQVRLGSR